MGAQRFTVGLAALLLGISLSQSATADLPSVRAAIAEGKTETVIEELKTLAAGKSAEAQMLLAQLHLKGDGVPKNHSLAFGWYLRAAEGGNGDAQFKIAEMYLRGVGTPMNVRAATRWLEKAAKQDHLDATMRLGLIHSPLHGHYLRDAKKSVKYLTAAADLGSIRAEQALDELRDAGFIALEAEEAQLLDPNSPAGRIQSLLMGGIETINANMQGMTLRHRGHIRVEESGGSKYEVTIPRARIEIDTGTEILLGTQRLVIEPEGEVREDGSFASYRFTASPTPRMLVMSPSLREDLAVTHRPKRVEGTWLTDVAAFTGFKFEVDDVKLADSAGAVELGIGSLLMTTDTIKRDGDRYDMPMAFAAADIIAYSSASGITVKIDSSKVEGEVVGLDLPRYMALLRDSTSDPLAMFGRLLDTFKNEEPGNRMIAGESMSWEIAGLRIAHAEDGELMSLAKGGFDFELSDLDKELNRFSLVFEHQGLGTPLLDEKAAGLTPTDSRLSLAVENVPGWQAGTILLETVFEGIATNQMTETGPGSYQADQQLNDQGLMRLAQVFSDAGARLDLRFTVTAQGAKVDFSGDFKADNAAAYGVVVVADLTVEGYENLVAKGSEAGGVPSEMITGPLSEYVDPDDKAGVLRLHIEQDRSGRLTINGREFKALPVPGLQRVQ